MQTHMLPSSATTTCCTTTTAPVPTYGTTPTTRTAPMSTSAVCHVTRAIAYSLCFCHRVLHSRKPVGRGLLYDPLELLGAGASYDVIADRCDLSHCCAASLWKTFHKEGQEAAKQKLAQSFSRHSRPNSKDARVCTFLQSFYGKALESPKALSELATVHLGQPITPRDISKGISMLQLSSKETSATQAGGDTSQNACQEVDNFSLTRLVWRADQLVFTDKKVFKARDIPARMPPFRIPNTDKTMEWVSPSFRKVEVIVAIGVVQLGQLLDGTWGDIGALTFYLAQDRLSKEEKTRFYTQILPRKLSPYSGPRSVVVLDNKPRYRQQISDISSAISAAGCFSTWRSPQSPELNLGEIFWDAVMNRLAQLHREHLFGVHGFIKCADLDDLIECLKTTRISRDSLHSVGLNWL
ncbi:hypothetical protein Pelo_10897 [Pelomyxa schiedti]|nr:hypothetical protein Pelo_10897 [Pelomyxa schiedti]